MPLPTAPPDLSGGHVVLLYTNGVDVHRMRVHVRHFAAEPSGPHNDYDYLSPTDHESSVLATVAALSRLWAPYYPPDTTIALLSLWRNVGGVPTEVDPPPWAVAVVGTRTDGAPAGSPSVRRLFSFRSSGGGYARLYLCQVPGDNPKRAVALTPSTGGFDAHDRDICAYLAGGRTAALCHDGGSFLPIARVGISTDRRLRWGAGGGDVAGDVPDQFMQSAAPVVPVQAMLWVDTSVGPPFQLRAWSADAEDWQPVGVRELPAVDIYPQATAPADPEVGWIWVDSSADPPWPAYVGALLPAGIIHPSGWIAEASQQAAGHPPADAIDVSAPTYWQTDGPQDADVETWFQVRFGGPQLVAQVRLDCGSQHGEHPRFVNLSVLDSEGHWSGFIVEAPAADIFDIVIPARTCYGVRVTISETAATAVPWSIGTFSVFTASVQWVAIGTVAVGPVGPVGPTGPRGLPGDPASTGVSPAGLVATDCLTFPRSATVCNDADGVVHVTTPGGHFALDATGLTLPGGHRLEVVE